MFSEEIKSKIYYTLSENNFPVKFESTFHFNIPELTNALVFFLYMMKKLSIYINNDNKSFSFK